MNAPIAEFVRNYNALDTARLHMPGHKGVPFLGCEPLDITEIPGADVLWDANGIIAQSEENASLLFGSARTFYSTEGSSQCIRAMLALAIWNAPAGQRPVVVAARNVHKTFLYAAALLDFDVVWLWPEKPAHSICTCIVQPEALEAVLSELKQPAAAVYITSPDYLGNQCDIAGLAEVSHQHGAPLLVDNAHGAYLRFLSPSQHPLDLMADLCCDSAHKTLPVLTGGAYLHVGCAAPNEFKKNGRRAMALFGSTSPSYLILQSLDLCNRYLSENYSSRLSATISQLDALRLQLYKNGWIVAHTDPLKLTIDCVASGRDGQALSQHLRTCGIECEYCDTENLVLMWTPENQSADFQRLSDALGKNAAKPLPKFPLPSVKSEAAVSIREGIFRPHEIIPVEQAMGRICGAPIVNCPPAIPIAVAGERIEAETIELFQKYGISFLEVLIVPP